MVSEWGTKRDAIAAVVTGTVTIQRVIEGLVPPHTLDDGEYPALMIGAFVENSAQLTWEQVETTTDVAVLYWNLATQEDISSEADEILNSINAASGTGTVIARENGEIPGRDLRVVRYEVEFVEVV